MVTRLSKHLPQFANDLQGLVIRLTQTVCLHLLEDEWTILTASLIGHLILIEVIILCLIVRRDPILKLLGVLIHESRLIIVDWLLNDIDQDLHEDELHSLVVGIESIVNDSV